MPIHCLARAIAPEDFTEFDYIFGMEYVVMLTSTNNVKNLMKVMPEGSTAKVCLFSEL